MNTQLPNNPSLLSQPGRAVSPIVLTRIPAREIVSGTGGHQSLELLVELPEFKLLRTSDGSFVVDCPIGTDHAQDESCGEYVERRQRKIVSAPEALRDLLLTVVPESLLPLLDELYQAQIEAVRSTNAAVDAHQEKTAAQ